MKRVVPTALAALLVLGLTGGGALYTKNTVDGADRASPTELGSSLLAEKYAEDDSAGLLRGRSDSELSKLLLPAEPPYRLGPDIGRYGRDGEISGEEAGEQLKDSVAQWPRRLRVEILDTIDKLRPEGRAFRSYEHRSSEFVVDVSLTRYGADTDAETMHRGLRDGYETMELFRDGPRLDGHDEARCFFPPQGEDLVRFVGRDPSHYPDMAEHGTGLDRMLCTATRGEHHIVVEAYGLTPFPLHAVTTLLENQLDHLTSPGMAI
ncbi:hypothetical protein PJ985_10330 [Streptomyces sp. ACA25]|uniref:hypothetical protein n=1 Tax=Streptomyces sp. ACA25 TaxID=3022596 RepID=UPI00230797C0|nr:hypothetical protein [Streptomyces sp. ACA25]MDB1087962.1 hypothetical protein [Streptomyces sp. ACA25]